MRNNSSAPRVSAHHVPETVDSAVAVLIRDLFGLYHVVRPLERFYCLNLNKLLRWHIISAAACLAGLAWYLGGSLVAWYQTAALPKIMDLELLHRSVSINFLLAFFALSWLFLRLRKVLSIPVDDLVKILGLEVPSPPATTLLEVTSNGATVHWKSPEHRGSIAKYVVRINGFVAGEFSHLDNAVTISGLPPDRCYTIRIAAVNSSNFQASSDPIRIKTLSDVANYNDVKTTGLDKKNLNDLHGKDATSETQSHHAPPTVVPYKAFPESLSSTIAPVMAREPSGGHPQPKKGSTSSKRGPSPISMANNASPHDREKETETIHALNNKLDEIRAQIQELEKQEDEEEAEFQKSQTSLIEQRDSLRKQLKERDDESKDLNKVVRSLEHANSIAQVKKSQQERALNEKIRAREKMQEDIARWDKEVPEIEAEILTLEKQREDLIKANEEQVQVIKAEQKPDLDALASIEEQIQECGREVKELEDEKKKLEEEEKSDSSEAVERNRAMAAEEKDWVDRISQLQLQLHNSMNAYHQSASHLSQAQQRLEMLSARRNSQVNGYSSGFHSEPQSASTDFAVPAQHSTGTRVNFDIPEPRGNPMHSSYINRTLPSSNTSYRTSSPFATSGMTMAMPSRPPNIPQGDLQANMDHLTGGAMTSPTAGDLLPSGLLGDDVEDLGRTAQPRNFPPQRRDPNLRSRPTSIASGGPLTSAFSRGSEASVNEPDLLPGLGAIPGLGNSDSATANPRSRSGSIASPSPSAVSSPHGSLANLNYSRAFDAPFDSDRRSIKSTSESAKNPTISRRFDIFGRQRGKTTTDGPALGSLKPSQSQSMPRDTNDPAHTFGSSRSQFRGAGGLFGQMSNAVLGRRAATSSEDTGNQDDLGNLGRAGSVSSFQSGNNPWTRPVDGQRTSNSRPGSTYSTENALPKPAVDVPRFGWGVSRESLHRPGGIQAGSSVTRAWSPLSSRRPSVQQDGQSASILEIGDAEADSDEGQEDTSSPPPAPIGTRPKKTKDQGELSKQLNPNARDFTSMFSFGRKGDKNEKANPKSKKKDKVKAQGGDDLASSMTDDSSPPDSRKSRDTLLSSNADSFEDDGIQDEQTDSHPINPHENVPQASPGGRDSLMKMLSRKGSSGKFSLPTLKDKSGIFSRKTNAADDHEDDSGSSAKMGRSVENISANPPGTPDRKSGGFSLSFKKKGKKGNNAPSISEASFSEASMASETGEEDAEDEEDKLNTP